ncbi:MAG: hypothetical protein CO094_00190 [Anaerolineae bacterium CG_4_9_14_3_um_filter_57_17]|nr:hypothetical protein [bacterium]NCT22094.1 hypothetical protein [bacterium]OIO83813.1 MAG: hypothetical protein AUK01_11595 [Anaerolineae bacterium CG2_30_57_67]PJB68737.1 MAG: hypothetical protein CO094_00190 [Anaerolineae bacterium CG_4_9_14_3_um_filter_57_17]
MSKEFSTAPSEFKRAFEQNRALFAAQPAILQRFLEAQAHHIAQALTEHLPQVKFSLPDRVVAEIPQIGQPAPVAVPPAAREQSLGGLKNRIRGTNVREEVRHRLIALEQSADHAIATSASLLRYAAAIHMVHNMLPAGRSVEYRADEGEEIATLPVAPLEPESAITQASDAIAEESSADEGRGDLQVPFVPAARRFYLPQWVSFDEKDALLVGNIKEAEANLASMQRYVEILHAASSLAPYILADEEYQKKRYGMLGQLINQGRALARYKAGEIIRTIKVRAQSGNLNRGLSLSLPYYDDQELKMAQTNFEVIPAGRIMFVPAFVVRAVHEEAAKRLQDTRFNASTRKHLLVILQILEDAFSQMENKK